MAKCFFHNNLISITVSIGITYTDINGRAQQTQGFKRHETVAWTWMVNFNPIIASWELLKLFMKFKDLSKYHNMIYVYAWIIVQCFCKLYTFKILKKKTHKKSWFQNQELLPTVFQNRTIGKW